MLSIPAVKPNQEYNLAEAEFYVFVESVPIINERFLSAWIQTIALSQVIAPKLRCK